MGGRAYAGHIWLPKKAAEVGATLAGNGYSHGKGPGKAVPVDQSAGLPPGRL
ncbi:hypothetical protein SUDANB108_00058 [Streptomyces sp. enrichment culture]|uniref:hypothetical protein n=1 Tax=Streptomyces sp. enrichment culture TaxID=1795815 RepID=UPI003F57C651